jgi:hypothetical protein
MEIIENGKDSKVVRLTSDEMLLIQNSLNELVNGPSAIEEWEFHARTGVVKRDAEKLLEETTSKWFDEK